tara:strand:- start:2646 stop:3515 length:870 start_codon:yes stop_codon:yes gene_type:complete
MTTINIVGYDTWYSERPWCRGISQNQEFSVVFNEKKENEITYFIRDGIHEVDNVESKIKVALLTECRPFDIQNRCGFISKNAHKFDHIVTYDDKLIGELPDKACPTPEGGTWVWPQERQQLYEKNKLCSYIVSVKQSTEEQKMRVKLLQLFYSLKNQFPTIDLYGRGHNPFPEDHDNDYDGKSLILKDYAFSIALENWIQDNYFSEKIMDCFMVGTVPIYMGARKIGDYFNSDGIIIVNSIEEILKELDTLSFERYNKMIEAVKENFEIAKKHYDTVAYSYNKFIKDKK